MERAVVETGAVVYDFCDSGRIYYRNDREQIAWGNLSFVLCETRTLDRVERAVVETGAVVYDFCDSGRIYYRNDREQMAWMECMGLYGA